jgi:hypothetical protein
MKVKLTTTEIVSRLRNALPEFKEEIDRKFIHELRSKGLIEFAGTKNFPNRLNPIKPYVASTFWFYVKDSQGYVKMVNAIREYLKSEPSSCTIINNVCVRRDCEDDIEWNHITSSSDPEFAREEDTMEFYLNRKEY